LKVAFGAKNRKIKYDHLQRLRGIIMMIEKYAFGKIVVNGVSYTSDIIILQGKVVPKWWRKNGHKVEVDDIKDIMKSRPDILVLGKGKPGLMNSTESLRNFLENSGVELIEQSTAEAIQMFNRLFQEGKNVAAGFHLTC
jgi:hypothetical protein